MVKTLQLLRNIKKEIKHGEARDLTAVESAIIQRIPGGLVPEVETLDAKNPSDFLKS